MVHCLLLETRAFLFLSFLKSSVTSEMSWVPIRHGQVNKCVVLFLPVSLQSYCYDSEWQQRDVAAIYNPDSKYVRTLCKRETWKEIWWFASPYFLMYTELKTVKKNTPKNSIIWYFTFLPYHSVIFTNTGVVEQWESRGVLQKHLFGSFRNKQLPSVLTLKSEL